MENSILQTVQRINQALDSYELKYALIGGLAASIRGRARATEDVDLVIDCKVDEAIELIDKLDNHGFTPFFPEVEQVVRQSYILALEDQTSKVKLVVCQK